MELENRLFSLNEMKEYYIALNYRLENEGLLTNIQKEYRKTKEAIRSLILLHMRCLEDANYNLDATVMNVLNIVNQTEVHLAELV
jgi:hypothetical protein